MQFGQTLLGYQGRAGRDLFLSLGIEHLQDPDNGESYHYFLRPDTGEYEVLALLQNATYANTYIGDTPAYTS